MDEQITEVARATGLPQRLAQIVHFTALGLTVGQVQDRTGVRAVVAILAAEQRRGFVEQRGLSPRHPFRQSALDSAWQRFITEAVRVGVISKDERFALHGLKHRGITDGDNKAAGGHVTETMRQRYDHELPVVQPPGKRNALERGTT